MKPVSYTHLDVYKRQVMGMPMDDIAYKLFGAYSEDRMTQLMDACGDYENEYLREHGGVLYDGVEDTICLLYTSICGRITALRS